jgi:hypothetical protein
MDTLARISPARWTFDKLQVNHFCVPTRPARRVRWAKFSHFLTLNQWRVKCGRGGIDLMRVPASASPQSYGERISNHHHFNVKLKTHEGKTFEVVLHPKSIAKWLVTGNKPILK